MTVFITQVDNHEHHQWDKETNELNGGRVIVIKIMTPADCVNEATCVVEAPSLGHCSSEANDITELRPDVVDEEMI